MTNPFRQKNCRIWRPFEFFKRSKFPDTRSSERNGLSLRFLTRTSVFQFSPVKEPLSTLPRVEIEEIYRGVDILRVQKGKKIYFQIAANLAGELLQSDSLNNHDVRDFVETAAKAARKRIEVDSSSDEVIIRSPKVETLRWCIDQIVDHFTSKKVKNRGQEQQG